MGSGGLVVLDDSDCMVDIARYFLAFNQDESCGKCTSCRIGTKRLRELLDRICNGKGKPSDLPLLDELAAITVEGSLCGLGTTAPNPALHDRQVLPRGVRGAPRRRLPGEEVHPAHRVLHHRHLLRLHALFPVLPGERDPDEPLSPPRDRGRDLHPV